MRISGPCANNPRPPSHTSGHLTSQVSPCHSLSSPANRGHAPCTFWVPGQEYLTHILCLPISCHWPFVQDPFFMKLPCIVPWSLIFPCSIHVHQTVLSLRIYSWKAGTRLAQPCSESSPWWMLSLLCSIELLPNCSVSPSRTPASRNHASREA